MRCRATDPGTKPGCWRSAKRERFLDHCKQDHSQACSESCRGGSIKNTYSPMDECRKCTDHRRQRSLDNASGDVTEFQESSSGAQLVDCRSLGLPEIDRWTGRSRRRSLDSGSDPAQVSPGPGVSRSALISQPHLSRRSSRCQLLQAT